MKECPHCHEETFSPGQLFALDYFHADQCKRCRKWVRNDGLRQVLMIPAILAIIFMLAVLPIRLPEPLVLVFLVAWLFAVMMLLPKPVKAEQFETKISPFTPSQTNDKVIIVSGWTEDELRKIIDDFKAEAEDFPGPPVPIIRFRKQRQNCYRLTFPEDVHPDIFIALVNQLYYPLYVGTDNRSIIAAGTATLNSDFEGIPESLLGQKAVFYVPEHDQDFIVVYLQTESGSNLAQSLDESSWRPVTDARWPAELSKLIMSTRHRQHRPREIK